MKNDILYLTHNTNEKYLLQILKSGKLMTTLNRVNKKIYTGRYSMPRKSFKNSDYNDEFPGIFLNFITKDHLNKQNIELNKFMSGITLIFSNNLLNQKNYHINLVDNNGFISENTFFPNNINEMPKFIDFYNYYIKNHKTNYYPGNEIVFHDNIDISNLCEIWISEMTLELYGKDYFTKLKNKLPKKYKNFLKIKNLYDNIKCTNNGLLDTNSLPFLLCFNSEKYKNYFYPYKTKKYLPKKFFKNIAKIANIDEETIIKLELTNPTNLYNYLVKNKLYSFYNQNRDLQNLSINL